MSIRHTMAFGATLAALVAATPALAEPIILNASDVGSSYTIEFNGFVDGNQVVDGLGGKLVLTLTGITGTSYLFDYAMTNTTNTANGVDSRVSSFAFNTDPQIDSASSTGFYNFPLLDSKYPNQIGNVDVCFKDRKSGSCAGNGGGAAVGQTGSGTLSLDFLSAPSTLTLDDFFIRYQGISGAGGITSASGRQTSTSSGGTTTGGTTTGGSTTGGTTTGGSTTGGSTTGGTAVPAPGMLALFGLGVFALGLRRRKDEDQDEGAMPAYA